MLAEAAKLLDRNGLGKVALMDVAGAAGIPRGSAYHYFRGWNHLVAELIDAHILALHERVGDADDAYAGATPEQRLVAIAAAFLEAIRDRKAEHRVQFAALHALPAPIADGLKRKHRWLAARIGEAIAAAIPGLGERPELLVPATMSFMSLASLSTLWFREDGLLSRADYARMMALMVVNGARCMLGEAPAAVGA